MVRMKKSIEKSQRRMQQELERVEKRKAKEHEK